MEDVGRGAARPFPQHAVQLSGSGRRQSAESHAARLRGFRLFLARVFRIQDGFAVRLFELLARQRRCAAEVLSVVRHRASRSHAPGASARTSHRTNRRRPGAGAGAKCAAEVVRAASPAAGARAGGGEATAAEAARACGVVRPIFAGGRRRRPNRSGARIGNRRSHRLLHGAADPSDAAPRDRLRRPLRTRSGAGQARGGSERCAGRLPRRRRGARRVGHAQALLARQFPVRA